MTLETNILKILAYFDMFEYPVSSEEIQFFMSRKVSKDQLQPILEQLQEKKLIYHYGNFYSLRNNPQLSEKRISSNKRAVTMIATARRIAGFLFRFPYVRGIAISGSLSKNVADEDADIDFFIITKANRLWLARTFMFVFVKFAILFGKKHWYCLNYYIDEEALQIEEKNIFTAMETITLIPVCGNGSMDGFFAANTWVNGFYPGYAKKVAETKTSAPSHIIKKMIERVFNNRMGDKLDDFLYKISAARWKKKDAKGRFNHRGGRLGMKTGKHFSKPDPAFFQARILSMYSTKINELEQKWEDLAVLHNN